MKGEAVVTLELLHPQQELKESTSPPVVQQTSPQTLPHEEKLLGYTLHFAQMRNSLKSACRALPKEATKPTRTAALYEAAYPQVRNFVQETLLLIQNDPTLRKQELAVKFLPDATIKVITMAGKSVDPKNFRLIREERFFRPGPDPETPIFVTPLPMRFIRFLEFFNIPLDKMFDRTREHIQRSETVDVFILFIANNAIDNLEEAKTALKSSSEKIHEIQKMRLGRQHQDASLKSTILDKKIVSLKELDERDEEMLKNLNDEKNSLWSLRCSLTQMHTTMEQSGPMVGNADEIKEILIEEMLALIQHGLNAADDLIKMLLLRKNTHEL